MKPKAPVLLDNTVLSSFASVQAASLPLKLWGDRVSATSTVLLEYRAGVLVGALPADAWSELRTLELTKEEEAYAESLTPRLGPGERSCLAVARSRGGIVVTDDLAARKSADRLGISKTGTLGILAACVRRDLLSPNDANRLLREMISQGFHSPLETLEGLI